MSNNEDMFKHTEEEIRDIYALLDKGRRDVPSFLDEGVCEEFYVPVEDGEIRVLHNKPDNQTTKRPILFLPGFTANPIAWIDFHKTHQGFAEYYYIESREKNSSRMNITKNTQFTVEQSAIDLRETIDYLKMRNKDYLLHGSSYGGAIVLKGVLEKYVDPPTTVVFDPIAKWVYGSTALNLFIQYMPISFLSKLRVVFTKIALRKMNNKAQKKRMIDFVKGGDPMKFRISTKQNKNYDIIDRLHKIENEVNFFTGPLDKYHPRVAYYNYAKEVPKGRFFFMNTKDEERQLLAGTAATAFANITKDDGIPDELKRFEIKIDRTE